MPAKRSEHASVPVEIINEVNYLVNEIVSRVRSTLTAPKARSAGTLTQSVIARRMGLSRAYVSTLLNHPRDMQLSTAVALLHSCGLRLAVVPADSGMPAEEFSEQLFEGTGSGGE